MSHAITVSSFALILKLLIIGVFDFGFCEPCCVVNQVLSGALGYSTGFVKQIGLQKENTSVIALCSSKSF